MPISVLCSSCGKKLKAGDKLAGRTVPCPNCQQPLLIPLPEEDAAALLLGDAAALPDEEQAPTDESVRPRTRPSAQDEPEETPTEKARRRKAEQIATLPPLTANEAPAWLRHLHWLLLLALLPLVTSLARSGDGNSLDKRIEDALEKASPDTQSRIIQVMSKKEGTLDDLISAFPGEKLPGAFLPRNSLAHWLFALLAIVLFMAFFVFLAYKAAEPAHLLVLGVFTATIGIAFLLLVQFIAAVTRGVWITGGLLAIPFYIIKLIGFSYAAATDPETGFLLSFFGFTVGVGFCEELCKALPLLWAFRGPSDQTWRSAFLWGLASGAGFGISEGIMYSSSYYNGIATAEIYVIRFLSCVALHALWSGSVGITIQQRQSLLHQNYEWYEIFPRLIVLVGIPTVLHGLYDTFLKKDMNAGALLVALASFAFLAYQSYTLHSSDDVEANKEMLREYKRRRTAMS